MQIKSSIRTYDNAPIRAQWDNDTSSWWYSAVDFTFVLTNSTNPRRYWNTFKTRHPELSPFCKQVKLLSSDNKLYLSDVINEQGVYLFIQLLPNKSAKSNVLEWFKGSNGPLDERSKRKAYELFDSHLIDSIEIGTTNGLQQIHGFLFEGLYTFAGKIRDKNISKDGFTFVNSIYLSEILFAIDNLPDTKFEDIISKYVEMNIAHPFMEGNGRATRIWLDLLLSKNLNKCIDWSSIDKKSYLGAMKVSPRDSLPILELLNDALINFTNDREFIMKGIDTSYYYEEIE